MNKYIIISVLLLLALSIQGCKHQYIQTGESNDGYIRFEVEPKNANVYVDDILVGKVKDFSGKDLRDKEKFLRVTSGHHILKFELKGYKTIEREVYAGHSIQTVTLRLPPEQ